MATTKTPEFLGTGRRKTAVARVRLATGTGKITVNGRPVENYFVLDTQRSTITQPLTLTGTADKLDVRVEEVHIDVRVLLVKGIKVDGTTRYSDYKKFNVETLSTIGKPKAAADSTAAPAPTAAPSKPQ